MAERSKHLVRIGWFFAFVLYITQTATFMMFMVTHGGTYGSIVWFISIIHLVFVVVVLCIIGLKGYAKTDKQVWFVWGFWFMYILLYTVSVTIIFGDVADKLKHSHTYGPNLLKTVLCIAPALLVLVLQLAICSSYRKGVLALSVFAALNLFDGIEMLEIVLMQNEREDFNLNGLVERMIIVCACFSFLVTSLGLARNEFDDRTKDVKERDGRIAVCLGLLEILFTNVPFLVLRVYVWADCGYEASIFIVKNVISLVVGFLEFGIACKCCACG